MVKGAEALCLDEKVDFVSAIQKKDGYINLLISPAY